MKIDIAKEISPDLSLRERAIQFTSRLSKTTDKKIIIDFSKVETITRSFAHEYLVQKRILLKNKQVIEENIPENVNKMFDLIKNPSKNQPILNLNKIIPTPI